MPTHDTTSPALLKLITSFVEYLSAAYSAMGLYSPEHPLAVALAEAVADGLTPLTRGRVDESYTLEIASGAFLWRGAPIPPKLVSQLASDLHALNAVELEISGTIDAEAAHTLLHSIHTARRGGGTIEDVIRVAEGIGGQPIRIVPLPVDGWSARAVAIDAGRSEGVGLVSDSDLAAMLRQPPEDPGVLADRIVHDVSSGHTTDTDAIRAWLLDQTDTACQGPTDPNSLRKAWLETCVQRLTPEVRARLLRSVPQPDPDWLLSVARLAPIWPIEELIAALENVTGDVTSLRGTGRLLFSQLLGFAKQDDQQHRVRSIIETWGANRPDSSLFASGVNGNSHDEFRSEDYAAELLEYATCPTDERGRVPIDDIEDTDRVATRAAEIAIELAVDAEDPDLAALGVSRTADALIRHDRTDLVLRALSPDLNIGSDTRSLSRRQRRLIAVLKKPDCIRGLLASFESGHDEVGVVRLLDLAGEHAAAIVLEFCGSTARSDARARALAWFRGLPPEARASAIGEYLSAHPQNADMLEPVCNGVEAFQIGHCVEHLVSGDQPEHTRAVLCVLSWCNGAWPASVVHHVISTPQQEILDEAIDRLANGQASTRSATFARVLCSLVSLRQTPIARLLPLVRTLKKDQRVAERAFVELLKVIRTRPTMIARGDAGPIFEALAEYETINDTTKHAIHKWRSPTIQLLQLFGRIGSHRGEDRRCA